MHFKRVLLEFYWRAGSLLGSPPRLSVSPFLFTKLEFSFGPTVGKVTLIVVMQYLECGVFFFCLLQDFLSLVSFV